MSSVSPTATASNIQMDYMKLLITQLQNQNPLEPLNNNEMASQLAQFSQLQQLENMNSSFGQVLATVQLSYADSLIGKTASYLAASETGEVVAKEGTVEQVGKDQSGKILLKIGNDAVALEEVVSVKN